MDQALWMPNEKTRENLEIVKFQKYIEKKFNLSFDDYSSFHQFSVKEKEKFWTALIDYFEVAYSGNLIPAVLDEGFKTYNWFKNVKLNFAHNLLKKKNETKCAINFVHESGLQKKISYGELKTNVASFSAFLKNYLSPGDVLGAYMPNVPETVISMLGASSLGAVFTSTSCDFGVTGVIDRFSQSRPKVLVAAIGYEYFGKYFDQTEKLVEIEKELDSLEVLIIVDFLNRGVDLSKFKNAILYSDIPLCSEISFYESQFSDPLYIMYSSGTTGKPKCIVHSQGGTLLQHIKELGLHCDLTENKKICYFTTCGWMMWNWLMSSLYFGSEIVLYEGSPAHPNPWNIT
jgi:acetoacetyl-CoA synthetase